MIAADEAEARATLEDMIVGHRFGDAPVVVEEFLEGVELSRARALRRRQRPAARPGA